MTMRPSKAFDDLNADQKQSLDWTRSIAIRANAGSGKTTVLVQRIVQILHDHRDLKLDHIVAITFTRKAGAQLKEKLFKALSECVATSSGDECFFWQKHLDDLPRCPIGTIDSLCHRLLKDAIEAGLESNLDPAFEILDGIDRSELLDQAIRRTEIELKDSSSPAHAAWTNWLTTQGRSELSRALRFLLSRGVDASQLALAFASRSGLSEESMLALLNLPALSEPLSHYRQTRTGLFDRMQNALEEMRGSSHAKKPTQTFQRVADYLTRTTANADTISEFQFIQALREALFTGNEGTIRKQGLESKGQPYFAALNAIQQEWSKWMPKWSFKLNQIDRPELVEQLVQIHTVASRHFRDLCREENRYEYGFLAQRTVQLLERSDARRLTDRYRFILVDEFQDTNEQQWRIVSGLAGIDPEAPVRTGKLMIVGDPQQSIYRFRQADSTVFERIIDLIQRGNAKSKEALTSFDQHLGRIESSDEQRSGLMRMKKNYRSRTPLPIEIINKLSVFAFDQVGTKPQPLEAGLKRSAKEQTEVVYVYPMPVDDDAPEFVVDEAAGVDASQADEADSAAAKLDDAQLELVAQELIRQYETTREWKKMAILLRSRNTHLLNLEGVLRAKNIPYQLVGGLGFWQRQEVRDLVSLANCLANGADEMALFAVLRGPFCGLDDSELLFLSTLGGRKLLSGLHRFATKRKNGGDWIDWHKDEATCAVLRMAFEHQPVNRLRAIDAAAERLDYEGLWRQRVDRMPHSELLMSALDESGAWGVYSDNSDDDADRRVVNLRMFFDEVRLLEAGHPSSLANMARRLKIMVDESTDDEQAELSADDNDAVQVMTVHAAKGLEFEVLAVIGLERKFNLQNDSLLLLDRFQHFRAEERDSDLAKSLHGLPVMSFRDPEMPLKKVNPLMHQALSKIEMRLDIEEEARIFHVAITRAERVLILAGAGSKRKTWPPTNSWQKWVHEALGIDRDIDASEWIVPGDASLRIRIVRQMDGESINASSTEKSDPVFDLQPLRESPRSRTIAATSLMTMLDQYRNRPDEWRMQYRDHVKPRAVKIADYLTGGTKRDPGEDFGKLVGTLVHRALEMGAAFPNSAKPRRELLIAHATALLRDRGNDPDEPGSADREAESPLPERIGATTEKILAHVLPNNPFKGLLEAEGESEVDFALPIGGWIITGRFDRLIRVENRWEIVDWKTDDSPAGKIVAKYRDQMKLYALALCESLPEPERPAEIVVHLAMTGPRSSQRLVFAANDLLAYRGELERRLGECDLRA